MSDWAAADNLQRGIPHTFNAMQKLIMAMADAYNSKGKTTFFGNDKGLKNYKRFEECLRDTLLAMSIDGLVKRTASPEDYWGALGAVINQWAVIFPTWPDAYAFAREKFGDSKEGAELIRAILGNTR